MGRWAMIMMIIMRDHEGWWVGRWARKWVGGRENRENGRAGKCVSG